MKKIFSILILVVFSAVLAGCSEKEYISIQSLYPGDARMWEHIFDVEEPYEFESAPFGVILPHHSITAFNLAQFYAGLAQVVDPSVVVVIGPNHFENGVANIQTCEACLYSTTGEDLELEEDIVDKLVDENAAVYNDQTFPEEHAVFAHSPFIKNYFPDAKVVPVALQWDVPIDEIKKLGNVLDKNLPDDALVIASIDFSHYVPDGMALFHDKASLATITNFDYKNFFDLELDSPASLYAFEYLMEKRGYMKSELLAHTNLTDFLTEHEEETTSHLYFAFYEGAMKLYEGVSILSFGNIPEDHTLDFMKNWKWDPDYDERLDYSTTKQLRDIRMEEDRFLVGADYLVFDLVDNECVLEEQNGMEVAFCKLIEDKDSEKEYLRIIKEAAGESDLVYLLFEYQGGGELDYDRKFFTRALAKKGVDIFVGRGIEEVILFETYRGNLLFHSLGDFIVDNQLITDLNALSNGMVLGLHVTPDYYYIYTFPVVVTNGYPALVDYSKRPALFNIFKEDAILGRRDEVDDSKGILKIKR